MLFSSLQSPSPILSTLHPDVALHAQILQLALLANGLQQSPPSKLHSFLIQTEYKSMIHQWLWHEFENGTDNSKVLLL